MEHRKRPPENDFIDGCDVVKNGEPTRDEDIAGLILFCDVDFESPDAVERRVREWKELFPSGT